MDRSSGGFTALLGGAILCAVLALPGCGGSDGDGAGIDDPPATTGMLRPVRNTADFEKTLKDALAPVVAGGLPDGPAVLAAMDASNFSGTYTVEAGVDELDIVRYDGTHLVIAPREFGQMPPNAAIRILRTNPAVATATAQGSIPLESTQRVLGMYLENDRLFVVMSDGWFGLYGDAWPAIYPWAIAKFGVQVYDIRNPAHPRKLMSATIDGMFVESRRIDDRVVIVSRYAPAAILDASKRRRLAQLPLAELLPNVTIDGRTSALVDARHCYVTNSEANAGSPVLTTISTISLAEPRNFDSACYDEAANGVYASKDALYISEPRFGTGYATTTRIHKFSLRGARPSYMGSAEIPGAAWSGGQADFRMNEFDGLLRVMTSELTGDFTDAEDHRLFVLRQKAGEPALEIVSRLPNDARPEKIGKAGESLYGVRFDGDRVYAVTFRRTDPLYVIDLSTPADPRIAGQLQLPGFSEFLHPVSEDLLLGLGMEAGHFKIELFDTAVLEHPQSRGVITLGGNQSYSPSLYDRHTFAYLPGDAADRFAVPATIVTGQPGVSFGADVGLHQFEIVGKQTPSSAMLVDSGTVTPPAEDVMAADFHRAFIDGNTVYYVREGQVWGTFWSAPSQLNGPF